MGRLLAMLDRLHSTSGGSSETELKELAVSPRKLPSSRRVVMTVTPVANWDRAWRKCAESKPGSVARGELVFICVIMPSMARAPRAESGEKLRGRALWVTVKP